jgi:hypothetical protein|tara:strand:- start:763 stop:1194 length:432 start_codon:yes stop_codon:yes gene_type:complete
MRIQACYSGGMVKNIFAVILGLAVGSAINMGFVALGPMVIPLPAGVDATSVESMKASAHLLEARHFIFPFIAHAAGSLVGGFIAYMIAASHKMICAVVVGVAFLAGGLMMVLMLPSPIWFIAADIGLAYIPAAMLGGKLAMRR